MTNHPPLGMPTLIELDGLDENVRLCRRLGLSFVELNQNSPLFGPQSLAASRVREVERREGIGFTVHLPEQLDIATFEPDMRDGHVRCVRNAIAWASQAGVRTLTMHLKTGVYFTLPDRKVWLYEKHCDVFLANLLDSMRQLAAPLADSGVRLLLENLGRFNIPFVQDALEKVLAEFSPHVGLTWDVGHDVEAGMTDRPIIQRHIEHVGHVHLHDTDGKSAHQPLFTGKVDVESVLQFAASRNLSVVIEVKTAQSLEQSVSALRERLGVRLPSLP